MDLRNLAQRVIVAVIAIPILLYVILNGGLLFLILIELLVILATFEYFNLAVKKNIGTHRVLSFIAVAAVPPIIFFNQGQGLWLLLMAYLSLLIITELFRKPAADSGPIVNAATNFFGVSYVSLLAFLLLIRELPRIKDTDYAAAGTWVLMIFISIWVCDTAAYFVGHRFGKRKLFLRVSPNKTVEGAIAGIVAAVVTAVICYRVFVKGLDLVDSIVIGTIAGSIGQIGDLVESLFKRDTGVKDSSAIIPGHGGILDRFDSQMLVAPAVYFYLRLIGI